MGSSRPCTVGTRHCPCLLHFSQICGRRVPGARFRLSRVDHCGCAWRSWIMSLGVLVPPGDGFHGPVPHGAQGLALCVWFKLCYNPVRKRQRVNYGYEFRGFFSGRRGGVVWCVCVWWGGGSSAIGTRVSRSSRVTRLSLPSFSVRRVDRRHCGVSRPPDHGRCTEHGIEQG